MISVTRIKLRSMPGNYRQGNFTSEFLGLSIKSLYQIIFASVNLINPILHGRRLILGLLERFFGRIKLGLQTFGSPSLGFRLCASYLAGV